MTIEERRDEILRIAARHGARNVRVFGSVARGEDQADSDVDLLVEMEDDRSLLDLVALEQDLEELLARNVDVLTDASIHPTLRARIAADARAL
jgi:predicted nucleotidyltransferase